MVFHGIHRGILSKGKRGVITNDNWSGLSLIFIPSGEIDNTNRTLAELSHDERIQLSHRNENCSAFCKFRKWYLEKKDK